MPQLQGMQDGVSSAGGSGSVQGQIPSPALQGAPPSPAALCFWICRQAGAMGIRCAGANNAILTGPMSPLVKRIAGVAQQRELPKLAATNFMAVRDRKTHPGDAFAIEDERYRDFLRGQAKKRENSPFEFTDMSAKGAMRCLMENELPQSHHNFINRVITLISKNSRTTEDKISETQMCLRREKAQ